MISNTLHPQDRDHAVSKLNFDHSSRWVVQTDQALQRALSICQAPLPSTESVPLGIPKLPGFFDPFLQKIWLAWIDDCDKTHKDCAHDTKHRQAISDRRPTRLLEVGLNGDPCIFLRESNKLTSVREDLTYVALSHPWGDPKTNHHLRTLPDNMEAHKQGIPFETLPKTFQDAVMVTRALRIRHLWIDSLCIIQGPDGDFQAEADRMESVFSEAYVVLAASCSRGTSDGFLKDRQPRSAVPIPGSNNDSVWICKDIDDFQRDVLEGDLNKRGWVLQERALARRTIFFTNTQTYWECGKGVRCETLTKMSNNQAAFLGDPNFPKLAEDGTKGARIRLYQSLYTQYSQLQFTAFEDRPIAIAGLEKRLIRAFETEGGFGLFKLFLHRSLMWQRAPGCASLSRIKFERKSPAPSWSWMAYQEAIAFVDLPFNGIRWEEKDGIVARFSSRQTSSGLSVPPQKGSSERSLIELTASVYNFGVPPGHDTKNRRYFVMDQAGEPDWAGLRCVTIGTDKKEGSHGQTHHVLIVSPLGGAVSANKYERVGVGEIPGTWIDYDAGSQRVELV